MRVLSLALPLAAVVSLGPIASAQPADAGTPGPYGRGGVHTGYGGGGTGLIVAPSVSAGVRLPSGLELGGYVTSVGYGDLATVLAFGPEIRLERALGGATTLDLRASGGVGLYDGEAGYRNATGLAAALEAGVTRRFSLGRGVDLAATGGAYASATRLSGSAVPTSQLGASAGVLVGLQLEFDALGGRVGVGPSGGRSLLDPGRVGALGTVPYLGALRDRGLVTFSF